MPAVECPVTPVTRRESTIIGLLLSVACPATLFVACWWTVAALSIYDVLPVGTGVVSAAAFTGLGLGLVLDLVFLKRWVVRTYSADKRILVPAYLAWIVGNEPAHLRRGRTHVQGEYLSSVRDFRHGVASTRTFPVEKTSSLPLWPVARSTRP